MGERNTGSPTYHRFPSRIVRQHPFGGSSKDNSRRSGLLFAGGFWTLRDESGGYVWRIATGLMNRYRYLYEQFSTSPNHLEQVARLFYSGVCMRTWRSAVILAIVIPASAGAATGVAKYAGEFLSLGVGGRALSMGGAYVALANDVTAGYWNPAGLSLISYPQFTMMHAEHFGSLVNYDYGAVAVPFGSNASLGLSVLRLGVDDIPDTRNAGVDQFGNLTYDRALFRRVDPTRVTYFNAADWAIYVTYAKRTAEDFAYGANIKIIRRSLGDHSATGIGIDVGAWFNPFENVFLGANIQDVTTTFLAWDTGTNELISPTMKIGSAYRFEALGGNIVPAVDLDIRFENRRYASTAHLGPVSMDLRSGIEYQFKNTIAVRGGYNDVRQWSLGAGVHLPKLNIDYSFARFASSEARLEDTHRISLVFTLESEQFKRVGEF